MSDNSSKRYKLIQELADIVNELGWVIAIPPDQITPGLIIGEENYVKDVANAYYGEQFEVVNPNEHELAPEEVELTEQQVEELLETGKLEIPKKPVMH
jgi:hypothetical protein